MDRSDYPVYWARLWLLEIGDHRAATRPEPSVKSKCEALYDGGWAALEETALADWDAGCRV